MHPLTVKTLFILGAAIMAGLAFLLSQEPAIISTTHFLSPPGKESPSPQPTSLDSKELLLGLENYLATRSGTWGVEIIPLTHDHQSKTKKSFGLNQDRSFPAASVMKLLVAANLINRADQQEFSLEKEIDGQPLADLLHRMINQTDNDAWYTLNHFLGFKNLQDYAEKLGMENSSVYENTLSPADTNLLLLALYQNKVASANFTQLLLKTMTGTETENRIPAGVPDSIVVSHKAGTWAETGTYSDAGIIEANPPFLLTLLSENASSRSEATQTIQTLTEKVFQFLKPAKRSS